VQTPESTSDHGPDAASLVSEQNVPTPADRTQTLWAILAFAFIAILLFWRISGFGIWDPWELATAEPARHFAEGHAVANERITFATWLVSLGFRVFGVHEWAGRVPIAFAGLISVLCAYRMGSRFADQRTGLYAALITGTSPLFLFNARTMVGAAPDVAVQSVLALSVFGALLPRSTNARGGNLLWLASSLVALTLAITTRGALLAVLPPLGAALTIALLGPIRTRDRVTKLSLVVLGGLFVFCVIMIARDALRDAPEYSPWIGGAATSTAPPTFDAVIEHAFHAFAPWSALLPIAMSQLWLWGFEPEAPAGEPAATSSGFAFPYACLVWTALGYGVETLFLSRYGREVSVMPLVALALLVALLLRDVERRGVGLWSAGIAVLLLVGLIIRDYGFYPSGPVEGLPLSSFEVPKEWNPIRTWSRLLSAFAACALFGLAADSERTTRLNLRAPYQLLRAQWRRSWGFKLWLISAALGLLSLCVFGALAYLIPEHMHMPTLAIKWVRRLLYLPFLIAICVALAQLVLNGFVRLGGYRFVPLLIAGSAVGAYAAQGFLPGISGHFSPREVYATYNALAQPNQPLAEYQVGGRGATFYAKGQVVEVTSVAQLIDHLMASGQRWAAFPNDQLADIDHAYRLRTGQHLVLADARSARVLLAASQPIPKRTDANYLRSAVQKAAPQPIQHPIAVTFDDRVELLGYRLELPHDGYVGAGESITLTWYYRVLRHIPSGYRLFVHIDGQGERIHGDHDPVDGKYPVQLWEPGDVIWDEQKIDVPASDRAGDYAILIGFYSGEIRLPIKQGPNDGEDRARVGVLRIQ
jgi:hypothetical protein